MSQLLRLLLTGPPGVGKSTIVERVVGQLHAAGVPINGFVTRESRDEGRRVGFVVETLDGTSAVLAHVSFVAGPKVGRYCVDVAAFDSVVIPTLREAVQRRDPLVIDEIGRMELASTAFVEVLHTILAAPIPLFATVHQVAHHVTDKLKQRPDVEVWTVRQSNRDALTDMLSTRLVTAWQANEQAPQ